MKNKKIFSRRDFVAKSATGFAGLATSSFITGSGTVYSVEKEQCSSKQVPGSFQAEVEKLPEEKRYAYHKKLSENPVHRWNRNPDSHPASNEMAIPNRGWKLVCLPAVSEALTTAIDDAQTFYQEDAVPLGIAILAIVIILSQLLTWMIVKIIKFFIRLLKQKNTLPDNE